MRWRSLVPITAAAMLLSACQGGGGGDEEPIEIGLAVERDVANLAFLVAEEQGFYDQCGLDASVTFFQGGGALMPSMASGDVDYGWVGTPTVIAAVEEGSPVKTIAEINQTAAGWGVIVLEDSPIQSLEDIEAGSKISFTSEGSGSHWYALWAAKQAGLNPDEIVGVPLGGSVPTIQSSLEKGDVDAAVVLLPWGHILEEEGIRWLVKFDEALPEMNFTGLHASAKALEKPEQNAKVLGAYVLALEWMQDNPEETRKFIAEQYDLDDDIAQISYDLVVPDLSPDGTFSEDHMQTLLDIVGGIPGFVDGTLSVEDILQQVEPAACDS